MASLCEAKNQNKKMKTFKNLYPQICDKENLWLAYRRSRRGKRFQINVAGFEYNLEQNLAELHRELTEQTYKPGWYTNFYITEPKKRKISAAPFRDRVVHHAICNVIEPVFEKAFIYDTYACRKEKGTHKAILRFSEYSRKNKYALKCDIKKYFPSIDHQILKGLIRRKIACKQTLWLIDKIIDNSNPQEEALEYYPGDDLFTPGERRKGIPIGNLTSQFFANIYLNGLDHYAKETLFCRSYIRYCDDFVLLSDDKRQLGTWKKEIVCYLQDLRLKLHENKSQAFPVNAGVTFLGLRVFPSYRRLAKNNLIMALRRLKRLKKALAKGEVSMENCKNSIMAWFGHARWADTYKLRQKIAADWELA